MKTKKLIMVIMVVGIVTAFTSLLVEGVGEACICFDDFAAEDQCVSWCTSQGKTCLIAYPYTGGSCIGPNCSRPYYVYCTDYSMKKYVQLVPCANQCIY
ncbi:MAG TPA: hypothetical protein ENN79_13065 [Desulfobacteraceae bacterium]|nr:hypothetical protein [Desulfobacteraceae bacterium]